MANRQTGRSAGAGEADEVLGGNIRDEQGGAYEKPTHIAASQEIVFGSSFFPGKVQPDSKDQRKIESDDDDIRGRQGLVSYLDRRCVEHPCLLLGSQQSSNTNELLLPTLNHARKSSVVAADKSNLLCAASADPQEAAKNCDGEVYTR